MSEKVGRCQYEISEERACDREALPDSKYCICHEKRDNKDIESFNRVIERIMKDKEANFYDFIGFYFPESFDFEIIYKHLEDRTFDKSVSFIGATFNSFANFRSATFQLADFLGATFKKETHFGRATFQVANFGDATFKKEIHFGRATFQGMAYFKRATFEETDFGDTTFQGMAYFKLATFEGLTDFKGATFEKTADFAYAKFKNIANFSHTTFGKRADFESCEIEEKIDFRHTRFHDELSLTNINGYQEKEPKDILILDFRNTRFSDTTWIGAGTNLENALFSLSRAELVDFSGSEFPEKIYEERLLEKKYGYKGVENEVFKGEEKEYCPKNWGEVKDIYRKLKQAHVKYGVSDKAEDFGYREWECKRKSKKETKSFGKYFLYTLFKYWLGYGKKPRQLLISAIAIILLFSGVYLSTGLEVYNQEDNEYEYFDSWTAPFEKCLYFSVITFTTVGYGDIHPHGDWARRATMIEAAIGVFMVAFFVATFVRRFV